jgi:hypothetical protein
MSSGSCDKFFVCLYVGRTTQGDEDVSHERCAAAAILCFVSLSHANSSDFWPLLLVGALQATPVGKTSKQVGQPGGGKQRLAFAAQFG